MKYQKTGKILALAIGVLLFGGRIGAIEHPPPPYLAYEIPFEYKNHFILVKLTFEHALPLTFIFDTGAETTLLTSIEIAELMQLTYEREIKIVGADLHRELSAFLVRNTHIKMGDLSLPYQSILVLEEDVFHFSEYTGMEVHGILGATTFRQFIVEIDYEAKVIRLIPPKNFRPPRHAIKLPVEISRSKPYLTTEVRSANDSIIQAKFLVDSGASLAMVIHPDTDPALKVPPKVIPGNIGMGLGGNLEGVLGILPSMQLGDIALQDIPAHYQAITTIIDSSFLNQRNGILGNKVLERFTVTLDYYRGLLYLKPNGLFRKPFPINKSGILIIAAGPDLKTFMVHAVMEDSPAGLAGVKPGDIIVNMNRQSFRFLDLDALYRMLSRKEGKKIRLKLDRDGEKLVCKFTLKKLL
jgi:predicted aspartyl protease